MGNPLRLSTSIHGNPLDNGGRMAPRSFLKVSLALCVVFGSVLGLAVPTHIVSGPGSAVAADGAPSPLLTSGQPVDWWFIFKFNVASFPGCGGGNNESRECPFGGDEIGRASCREI